MKILVSTIVAILCATAAMAAPFTNGGFEDPVLPADGRYDNTVATAWSTYASSGFNPQLLRYAPPNVATPPEGAQYGQMQITVSSGYAGYYQTFDTIPGVDYVIDGWFRSLSGTAWARIGVDANGGNARPSMWLAELNDPNTLTPWTPFSVQATAAGTSMTLFLDCEVSNTNKAASFDGITVEVIPEASSMLALLSGLPILGLAIRRRK